MKVTPAKSADVTELISQQRHLLAHALSHELRTPLVAAMGLPGLLLDMARADKPIDRAELEFVAENIQEGAQRLVDLVEKFEIWAELERAELPGAAPGNGGRSPFEIQADTLAAELTAAAARARRTADLRLKLHSATVHVAHSHRLYRITRFMVDNALKYSTAGSEVEVATEISEGRWTIEVTDEGCGVMPARMDVEAPFVQFDSGLTDQQGIGLGLCTLSLFARKSGGSFSIGPADGGRGLKAALALPLEAS